MRLHLMRISAEHQAEAVRHVFALYGERLRALGMDKTGNGLPLWQMLDSGDHTPVSIQQRIKGYGFSQKLPVEFDQMLLDKGNSEEDSVIIRNIVDYSSDELRKLVDGSPPKIELPNDRELLTEWQGQEVQYVRDEGSAAGIARRYSQGSFHTLDAARMMIAARNLDRIEQTLALAGKRLKPTLARFG
jgi:hypothetical protein